MNRNDLIKQQTDLQNEMRAAHTANDHAKFNELLVKHNDIDTKLAKIAEDEDRAAKLKELEARANQPQGRVTAPAGAPTSQDEVRATKEYETNFRTWFRSRGRAEVRGLGIFSDPDGGYLLTPARMEQEILAPVKNVAVIQSKAKYELLDGVLSSQGINVTAITGNSQKGSAVTLTSTTTDEDFGWSKRKMRSNPFVHWFKIPNELIDFAGFDITSWLVNEVRERKTVSDDYRFLYGTGVDEPLGLLTADNDGIGTSRDKVITSSGVITYELLISAFFNLKPQHRANAEWLFDTAGIRQIMQLDDSQGRPLDPLGLTNGTVPRLMGKPVTESNNIQPTMSSEAFSTSQYIGLLGDFKRYHIMESKRVTVQLDPYRLSDENVTICYLRSWMDGMPVLSEAWTRLKSNS